MPIKLQLVTILFIVLATSFVQKMNAQNFSLGIKAGPGLTSGRFKDSDLRDRFNTQPYFGFTAGGLILFPLKKNYSFVAETVFTRKGKKIKFNDDVWTNTASFNFIDISMALRKSFDFKLRPNVNSKIFFGIGPNIEYWLNGKGSIDAGGPTANYEVVFDKESEGNFNINYYNEVNRWLFGLDLGVGMEAPITSKQKVFTELRFTLGQTNLGKVGSTSQLEILGFQDDLKMNFKTISLTVAYLYDFDLKEAKKGKSTKDKMIKRKKKR